MESASIVSFNNDSTLTPPKGDYNNISVHELALHAMRDRCLLLQRRINSLENDNMRLKLDINKATENSPYIPLQEDEKFLLNQKIAELNKQKSQLMHHVFMVSCENKNLWNKVSTLRTDKSSKENTKHPLLRTNTYIHSTPKGSANYQEKYSEASLEEISLKLINSYIQEKSQLVEQYEQMSQLQDIDDDNILNVDSIGFTYIEDPATDSLKELQNQSEKLHQLKNELAQQEQDLKIVISRVQSVLQNGYNCPSCAQKNSKVFLSEEKGTCTSDSLCNLNSEESVSSKNNFTEGTLNFKKNIASNHENETKEEPFNKICPMCGKTFNKEVEFSSFQSHVENHFIGDSEPDSIIDTLENIPDSIDNML